MNIQGLNGPQDINTLKRLLAQGLITQDDLSGATISGSMGPSTAPVQGTQNAISDLVNPGPQDGSQAPQQPSSQDLAAQGQQFVRNESTGQTMYMGPNGPADIPYSRQLDGQVPQAPQTMPNPSAAFTGPRIMPGAQQGQMRVVGSGQGQVTDLGTEPAKAVPLDYSRSQIDVPGVGRGYYGRDGNAYVSNPDGSMTKVLLGYDAQGSMALTNQKIAQQKSLADIAHTAEQIRASKANNPDFGNANAIFNSGITGDAVLQAVDPGTAATIKSMLDGRMQPPGQMALRSPRVLQLINLANQVDPNFDATTWARRYSTAQEFAKGKSYQTLNALNTVAGHLDTLDNAIGALDNVNTLPGLVNPIKNLIEQKALGHTEQTNYATVLQTVAPELERAYRGAGGDAGSLEKWRDALSGNNGIDQQRGAVRTLAGLLQSKIDALGHSYSEGMGKSSNGFDLLSPKAAAVFQRLQGLAPQAAQSGQSGQPAQTSQQIPQAAIAFLRQNPAARFDFDAKYGQGASAQVLGQ